MKAALTVQRGAIEKAVTKKPRMVKEQKGEPEVGGKVGRKVKAEAQENKGISKDKGKCRPEANPMASVRELGRPDNLKDAQILVAMAATPAAAGAMSEVTALKSQKALTTLTALKHQSAGRATLRHKHQIKSWLTAKFKAVCGASAMRAALTFAAKLPKANYMKQYWQRKAADVQLRKLAFPDHCSKCRYYGCAACRPPKANQ